VVRFVLAKGCSRSNTFSCGIPVHFAAKRRAIVTIGGENSTWKYVGAPHLSPLSLGIAMLGHFFAV
jgi:hypothetical protein